MQLFLARGLTSEKKESIIFAQRVALVRKVSSNGTLSVNERKGKSCDAKARPLTNEGGRYG